MALAPPPRPLRRRALFGALALIGCSRKPEQHARARVVSLSPSTTEAVFSLGAGDQLVGRSDHCDYPEAAKRLPSIGGYSTPDIEAIVALKPSLVVGSQSPVGPVLEDRLAAQGIATYFPVSDTIGEITTMLQGLGERLGVSAEGVVRDIDERVARVSEWAKAEARVRVVIVFDVAPVFVAGKGSFPDELTRIVGGENLIERGGKWPTIDIEHLARLDPAVIVDAMNMGAASRVGKAPGWEQLSAVRAGRVRTLRSAAAIRPGPRIAEALADMALAIHGREPPV
jgi:iron complex transport system substrate-binding protein